MTSIKGVYGGLTFEYILEPTPQQLVEFQRHALGLPATPAVAPAPADDDVLGVAEAARLLRCSERCLRGIGADQLPFSIGPSRRRLYLRRDLIAYLRRRRADPPKPSTGHHPQRPKGTNEPPLVDLEAEISSLRGGRQ